MKKPVLYLQRDRSQWIVVHQGKQLSVVAAGDVKLEQALQMAQAAHPDYWGTLPPGTPRPSLPADMPRLDAFSVFARKFRQASSTTSCRAELKLVP